MLHYFSDLARFSQNLSCEPYCCASTPLANCSSLAVAPVLLRYHQTVVDRHSIQWLESPYGYPGFEYSTLAHPNITPNQSVTLSDYACCLIKPSIANLQAPPDIFGAGTDWLNLPAGNSIYVFTEEFRRLDLGTFVRPKRLAKVRRARKYLNLHSFQLPGLQQAGLLDQVQALYYSHLSAKLAPNLYRFPSLWDPYLSPLHSIDHTFYLAFSKADGELCGFLLRVGDVHSDIFLSSVNDAGRSHEAASLLRYTCIQDALEQEGFLTLNTGGVNTARGGDPSFKRSFGALEFPYSVYVWINRSLYPSLLQRYSRDFDPSAILFWRNL